MGIGGIRPSGPLRCGQFQRREIGVGSSQIHAVFESGHRESQPWYFQEAFLGGKEYSEKWRAMYPPMGKILNTLGLVEK